MVFNGILSTLEYRPMSSGYSYENTNLCWLVNDFCIYCLLYSVKVKKHTRIVFIGWYSDNLTCLSIQSS